MKMILEIRMKIYYDREQDEQKTHINKRSDAIPERNEA